MPLKTCLLTFLLTAFLSQLAVGADYHFARKFSLEAFLNSEADIAQFKNELKNIALEYGAELGFSEQSLKEAEGFQNRGLSFEGLDDLTHMPFITMDNDESKDLDQAFYIEKDKDEASIWFHYAIADASYFVTQGSAIDQQASDRLFTKFIHGDDFPMLPRLLSEDLCSLVAGKDRRAVVVSLLFNASGKVVERNFRHAKIRSRLKTSYRLVQKFFDGKNASLTSQEYTPSLEQFAVLGKLLVHKAKKRGVIRFPDHDLFLSLDSSKPSASFVAQYQRFTVELWNEQLSIAANEAVAEQISEKHLRSIHRYHPKPFKSKIRSLHKKLKPWNRKNIWKRNDDRTLAAFVDSLDKVDPLQRAIQLMICKLNIAASYSVFEFGHSGLKLKHYDHFTAPMRRYSDIVVHRILLASIKGEEVPYQASGDLGPLCERINNVMKKNRKLEHALSDYIQKRIFQTLESDKIEAYLMAIDQRDYTLELIGLPFDLKIKLSKPSEWLRTEVDGKQVKLGEKVKLDRAFLEKAS